ncbi:MAG: type II secretion system protein [Planctomycetota bacterium]|jgi:prepilin-type N-terminal cleavage/methylation domain-containing protein/prepilin-type processing-associated H-X9-DG protein
MITSLSVRKRRGGFTLIELLVVISIIALLISILLPSLSSARRMARTSACGQNLRGLSIANSTYTTEFEEWLPGVNTTGAVIARYAGFQGGLTAENIRKWDFLPVQKFDWMTPSLSLDMDFSGMSRADRLAMVSEIYRCPEQEGIESKLYPENGDGVPDADDFEGREWSALSYLQSVYFQYWGENYAGKTIFPRRGPLGFLKVTAEGPHSIYTDVKQAPNYRSRLVDLGTPGKKIFAADGQRFITEERVLDHDISMQPNHFGMFTTPGAWRSASVAYGVKPGSARWANEDGTQAVTAAVAGSRSKGYNLRYSYRHGGSKDNDSGGDATLNRGKINAAFFDGSVSLLTDRQSRKPGLWLPKGTEIREAAQFMTQVEDGDIIRH